MREERCMQAKRLTKGKKAAIVAGSIALAVVLFFSGWLGCWLSLGSRARSLLWAVGTAEKYYYKDVDEGALYDAFFDAFALDPYSRYYTKEEYAAVLSDNAGNGADTGLSLTIAEVQPRIFGVRGNSPADRAGLLSGMYISAFGPDAEHLQAGTREELLSYARTHGGPLVLACGFEQDGADAALYTVASEQYAISECLYRDSERALRFVGGEFLTATIGPLAGLPSDTAYIRLDEFYGRAKEEFERCLSYMVASDKVNLILDLRCNGGGYLSVFQELAAFLMRNAEGNRPLAATAKDKSGRVTSFYAAGNRFGEFFKQQSHVYVLADENTASASECLIGALVSAGTCSYADIFVREQDDGSVKTYGKGIMQSHYTDPAGNVLKLTSAEIFWPNGRSIHGTGVTAADGAIGIAAPLLPSRTDAFLTRVLEIIGG